MAEKVLAQTSVTTPVGRIPTEQDFQTDTVTIPVKLCNLPPLNSIANQVLSLSADPDVDIRRLAFAMEADPAFAAEVLLLANSSLFGFTSRMSVLRHAIAVLGLDRIKALAVTVAMRAFLGQGNRLVRECWRHSAACAVIAEEISPIFDVSGDHAYTIALMHDIGRLGLLKSYPREIVPVLEGEYNEMAAVLAAERAAIQVDHGVAGSWLVKNWAYPPAFAEICEHHHKPINPADSPILLVVKLACQMADSLGYSAVHYDSLLYPELLQRLPGSLRRDLFPGEKELQNNLKARLAVFEIAP